MICQWSIQGIPGSPASGLDAAAGASTSDLMGDTRDASSRAIDRTWLHHVTSNILLFIVSC